MTTCCNTRENLCFSKAAHRDILENLSFFIGYPPLQNLMKHDVIFPRAPKSNTYQNLPFFYGCLPP